MADEGNAGKAGGGLTFTTGVIAALVVTAIVAIVGFLAVGPELGVPVIVLFGLCAAVAVAYRMIGSAGPEASTDPGGSSIPQLATEEDRPMGDTQEAHDELNPHDLPKDMPVRQEAVEMSEGTEGTTQGKAEGGATGRGGSEEGHQEAVGSDEAHGGARATGHDN